MDRNSDLSVNVSVDEDCILAMTLNPGLARREGLRGLERLIVITWGYFSKAPEFFSLRFDVVWVFSLQASSQPGSSLRAPPVPQL